MNRCKRPLAVLLVFLLGLHTSSTRAEGNGQADFDEALRVKVTAENLHDLNKVVELLESSIEKGLDLENNDLAEQMLKEALLERAMQLGAAVQAAPPQKMFDPSLQRVRALAVSDLRRVLEYDDVPPMANALLAQLLAMPGGDPKEAIKLLNEMFASPALDSLPPKMQAGAHALRGKLLAGADPDKALTDFNAALELDPKNLEHRLARADFYNSQKKYDEAVADIDAVIEQQPEVVGSYLVKATILREQNKLDEALTSLDKAAELAPSAPGVYQQRGEVYRLKEDFPKAIEQFDKVLQMQPGLILTLIHRAEAYLNNKQYDEALADVEAVIKANPELSIAHGLKAQTLANLERFPEAIAELKKLTGEESEKPEYRLQLALYYLFAKQPREAIAAYTELLDEDADNFPALRGRADAYLHVGEHANAAADFKRAIDVEPKDPGLLNNYAWVLATSPDDDVRNGKLAIELAQRACEETDYEQSHILSTLAAAHAEAGDFDKAREWSRKAIETFEKQRPQEEATRGKAGTEELAKELAAELASFEANKPWRERQTSEQATPETSQQQPAVEE